VLRAGRHPTTSWYSSNLPRLEGQIRRLAQKYSGAAVLTIVRLMNSANDRVALAACLAVLDRAIGKSPQLPLQGYDQLSDDDYRNFAENLSKAQAEVDKAARIRSMFKWP
jgi:hypothetical protein